MANSLFQGAPQTATSYTTSSTETPKWMQDAIYNQIQVATNIANTPYQAYGLPTVAELSPLQQQAYQQVQANQGQWKPAMQSAMSGMEQLSGAPGGLDAASPYFTKAANTDIVGAASPYINQQGSILSGLDYSSAANALQPYVDQALTSGGLQAASPYLQQAAQGASAGIQNYMNPYTSAVTDKIAELGARNLSENLLPNVSDAFIRAGQFGGTRMGEFGSRALRDTQESILGQQAQALQSGYGQALTAAQQDAARAAQLASTAGSLGSAQQQAVLQGGQALSSAEQQAIAQQLQGAGQYGQMASTMGGLSQAQGQLYANLGAQAGQLAGADLSRKQGALQGMANLAQQGQAMGTADVAALESAGLSQQNQQQRQLDAAYQQFQAEQLYPKQQMDWLSTQIRGMAPITPQTTTSSGTTSGATYSASPLSQLASGLSLYKGLTSK